MKWRITLVCIFLAACTPPLPGSSINPPEDELIKSVFDSIIQREQINHTINSNGFYLAEEGEESRLLAAYNESWELASLASEVVPKSDCALQKYLSYLQANKIIYVQRNTENGVAVKTTSSDFDKYTLVARLGRSELECQGKLETSPNQ